MIDNYLLGNKFTTSKPLSIKCERYQLIGKQQVVEITIDKDIEILNIGRKSLLFLHNNLEYIYHDSNIDNFIHKSFIEHNNIFGNDII